MLLTSRRRHFWSSSQIGILLQLNVIYNRLEDLLLGLRYSFLGQHWEKSMSSYWIHVDNLNDGLYICILKIWVILVL